MAMRWVAVLTYVLLVAFAWVNAGVTTGLIVVGAAVFLVAVMRPNDAGEAITGFARRLFRPPSTSSS